MSETMINPPRTIMEVFKMLSEGTLAEVINNTLYRSPAPSPFRQRLILSLATILNEHVSSNKIGEVFVSPVDVYLDSKSNAVQPDVLLILSDNKVRIDVNGIYGVPNLIIEILSPGNQKHDKIIKKDLYEKFGVEEYWIIDPDKYESTGYSLKKNQYQLIAEETNKITSPLLNGTFLF